MLRTKPVRKHDHLARKKKEALSLGVLSYGYLQEEVLGGRLEEASSIAIKGMKSSLRSPRNIHYVRMSLAESKRYLRLFGTKLGSVERSKTRPPTDWLGPNGWPSNRRPSSLGAPLSRHHAQHVSVIYDFLKRAVSLRKGQLSRADKRCLDHWISDPDLFKFFPGCTNSRPDRFFKILRTQQPWSIPVH